MNQKLILIAFICSLLVACKDKNTAAFDCGSNQFISLKNPQIGQKNRYLMLEGSGYSAGNGSDFDYLPDTMVVEITGQDSIGFIVKEYFTAGSADLPSFPQYIIRENEAIYSHVRVEQNEFVIIPGSNQFSRFWFSNNQNLTLNEATENPITLDGWVAKSNPSSPKQLGFATDVTLLGTTYPRLNIVINNSAMLFDGPGFNYIYDPSCTLIRSTTYSSWTDKGFAYDLLPN
jgi:hypothetical protein